MLQGRRAEAIVALAAFREDADGALAGIEMAGMAGGDAKEGGGGGDPSGAPAAVVAEIDEIAAGIATMSGTKTSDLFYNKTLWRAMWIACTLVMFQQFTGQPNVRAPTLIHPCLIPLARAAWTLARAFAGSGRARGGRGKGKGGLVGGGSPRPFACLIGFHASCSGNR